MTVGMKKNEHESKWIERLRGLMESHALNPRSLSLKAGLNPTAVRDMLEGRVKYPRYDTVEALAKALDVTPAQLMSGETQAVKAAPHSKAKPPAVDASVATTNDPLADEDLNLLVEIIARLQEAAEAYKQSLEPKDFAAMVTTIYRQVQPENHGSKQDPSALVSPKIHNLMDYERLRKKAGHK